MKGTLRLILLFLCIKYIRIGPHGYYFLHICMQSCIILLHIIYYTFRIIDYRKQKYLSYYNKDRPIFCSQFTDARALRLTADDCSRSSTVGSGKST